MVVTLILVIVALLASTVYCALSWAKAAEDATVWKVTATQRWDVIQQQRRLIASCKGPRV